MYRDVNIDVGGKGGGAIRRCIIHFYMVVFYEEPGERLWSFLYEDPRGDFSEFAQLWHHIDILVVFFFVM